MLDRKFLVVIGKKFKFSGPIKTLLTVHTLFPGHENSSKVHFLVARPYIMDGFRFAYKMVMTTISHSYFDYQVGYKCLNCNPKYTHELQNYRAKNEHCLDIYLCRIEPQSPSKTGKILSAIIFVNTILMLSAAEKFPVLWLKDDQFKSNPVQYICKNAFYLLLSEFLSCQ